MFLGADLRAGYAFGAFQINHLTVILQIVKMSVPVRSDGKNIYIIAPDIINFLPLVFFYDDLVGQSRGAHRLNALHEGLLHIDFSTGLVEVVCGYTDDQIVPQCLGALEQANVAIVQQIVGSVSNYSRHLSGPVFYNRPRRSISCMAATSVVLSFAVSAPIWPTRKMRSASAPPLGQTQIPYSSFR